MISIAASDLHRMFQQVTPHMLDPEEYLPVISSVRLEVRDGWLYVAATDRFTFAVARREILPDGNRIGHVPGHLVAALTAWLDGAAQLGDTVSLSLPTDDRPNSTLSFAAPGRGAFTVEYDADDYKGFPEWRRIFHRALTAAPIAVPVTGFTTRFLARWQHAAERLTVWQEAPRKPFVFLSEDGNFAGLHCPTRYPDDQTREDTARDWIAATTPTATVDGRTYDLTRTWSDRHGDPWTYSGKDCPDGMPLMVIDGIEDDPHPLDQLISTYGPLHSAA